MLRNLLFLTVIACAFCYGESKEDALLKIIPSAEQAAEKVPSLESHLKFQTLELYQNGPVKISEGMTTVDKSSAEAVKLHQEKMLKTFNDFSVAVSGISGGSQEKYTDALIAAYYKMLSVPGLTEDFKKTLTIRYFAQIQLFTLNRYLFSQELRKIVRKNRGKNQDRRSRDSGGAHGNLIDDSREPGDAAPSIENRDAPKGGGTTGSTTGREDLN